MRARGRLEEVVIEAEHVLAVRHPLDDQQVRPEVGVVAVEGGPVGDAHDDAEEQEGGDAAQDARRPGRLGEGSREVESDDQPDQQRAHAGRGGRRLRDDEPVHAAGAVTTTVAHTLNSPTSRATSTQLKGIPSGEGLDTIVVPSPCRMNQWASVACSSGGSLLPSTSRGVAVIDPRQPTAMLLWGGVVFAQSV